MSICAVTGAFGYSGRRIAERLLAAGEAVRTLTHSPNRANPFGNKIEVFPYNLPRQKNSWVSVGSGSLPSE